jgi:hypothetical protein
LVYDGSDIFNAEHPMTTAEITDAQLQGRPTWPYEPLYKFLHLHLPAFRHPSGILDVEAVAADLGIVSESIYKWFRSRKLPLRRAADVHRIIHGEDNAKLLAEQGVPLPDLQTLYAFGN